MNTFQIIVAAVFLILILLKIKKYFETRNIVNYTAEETASKLRNNKNVILLDVRTDGERERGYIKGSLHKPLHTIKAGINDLAKYKDKEIICYCQSGARSLSAALILQKNGFNAANLLGGYSRWPN